MIYWSTWQWAGGWLVVVCWALVGGLVVSCKWLMEDLSVGSFLLVGGFVICLLQYQSSINVLGIMVIGKYLICELYHQVTWYIVLWIGTLISLPCAKGVALTELIFEFHLQQRLDYWWLVIRTRMVNIHAKTNWFGANGSALG